MMKKIHVLFLVALCVTFFGSVEYAQSANTYDDLTQEARAFYRSKDFSNASQKYEEAITLSGKSSLPTDRFYAACAYAMIKKKDKSFSHLNYLADSTNFSDQSLLNNVPELANLHRDRRWSKVNQKIEDNQKKTMGKWEFDLMGKLNKLYQTHQNIREEVEQVEQVFGFHSIHYQKAKEKQDSVDFMNINYLIDIIEIHGWPGTKSVGQQGCSIAFYLLQISPMEVQSQILPLIKESVKKGNTPAEHLAHLEDRLLLKQGQKQLYGTQIGRSSINGEYLILPIESPENLDTRRSQLGMEPMGTYLKNWNLTWSLSTYEEMQGKLGK